jgi:hypothetical protein
MRLLNSSDEAVLNRAAGPLSKDRPWPDWTGQTVAIVASGPSAKAADPGQLNGRIPVLAIKRSWELVPFCEAIYGCDAGWWLHVNGLPEYAGLKLSYDRTAIDAYGLKRVSIPDKGTGALRFAETGVVGSAGNSGFQALNLAAQWGAKRILLVGFDMHDKGGVHWYGRNTGQRMSNPDEQNFRRWRVAFTAAAPVLTARGIEVVDAAPKGALTAFRKRTIAEALKEWELS